MTVILAGAVVIIALLLLGVLVFAIYAGVHPELFGGDQTP